MSQPDDTFPKESNTELKRQRDIDDTGGVTRQTSAKLTTPNLGTLSAGALTDCTGSHVAEVLREEWEDEDEWTNQESACMLLAKEETERYIERETRKFVLKHPDPLSRPPLPTELANPQIKYGEIYAEYMALSAAIASAMQDRRKS